MIDGTYSTLYDILYSITQLKSTDLSDYILEQISQCEYLDTDEKTLLTEFKSLKEKTISIPTPGVLVSKNIGYSTAKTISEESIEDIVNIFISNKRKSVIASKLTNAAMELTKQDADENKISELVNSLFYNNTQNDEEYINPYEIDKKLEELHSKQDLKGIQYGIQSIDEIYPGTTPSSFTVIAGYTGSMKTTLAVNHCFMHMLNGKNTLYISLEVNEEDLIMNLMSLYTINCTNEPIKRDDIKKMRNNDKEKFDKIYTELMSLPGKIVFRDEKTLKESSQTVYNEVIHKVNKELEDNFSHGLDLIVLDHAQLLKYDSTTRNSDPYQILNRWTDFFRRYAARDGYAVILVSQTSRGGYEYASKHGGQYLLTGLAEGNELERGATCVITLYSNDESRASGEVSVQILKNRYGPTMLEPQTVVVKPEYYLIGNGYSSNAQQVDAIFTNEDIPVNPFNNQTSIDLNDLLGGM